MPHQWMSVANFVPLLLCLNEPGPFVSCTPRLVKFADLFADENREVLLELQLPATQQDDRQTQQLVKVCLSQALWCMRLVNKQCGI